MKLRKSFTILISLLTCMFSMLSNQASADTLNNQIESQNCAVMFPGTLKESVSPDKSFRIENIDESKEKHRLVFFCKDQPKGKTLLSYGRSVEMLWSPNSEMFVINDWAASNLAFSYLYKTNDILHPIDINEALINSTIDKKEKEKLTESGHVYITANKWLSPCLLKVKACCHDGKVFEFFYIWDLKKSLKKIRDAIEFEGSDVTSNRLKNTKKINSPRTSSLSD